MIFHQNLKLELNLKILKIWYNVQIIRWNFNRKPNQHLPYVGAAAFSHKGGLHVSAVQKDPKLWTYKSRRYSNTRNIVVSDRQVNQHNFKIKKYQNRYRGKTLQSKILEEVKDRELIGYSYDGADASFELLARRIIGETPRYISINEYDVR